MHEYRKTEYYIRRASRESRWIDTALELPVDIVPWQTASAIPGYTYRAEARSTEVFAAGLAEGPG
jgi:hypothetical protein